MTHKPVVPILALGILFLLALAACAPPTPTPSPTPGPSPIPSPTPPPASTWVNDQLGVTWGNTPIVARRIGDRVGLAQQAGAAWDRWSAFWFWVEQPDRWGYGNFVFSEGDESFTHPDTGEVTWFNIHDAAAGNQDRLDTLTVLDGISRPYDCIATTEGGSLCYGSNERIQGLFLDPLLDGSANPDNHWADYVYHTVGYFKQFGIQHYQAYNEPNLGYWNGGDDPEGEGWANDYARLVQVTLAAAQAADPQANIVLAASISNMDQYQSDTWLDTAYRHIRSIGLQDEIHAIALHSYQFPVHTQEMYRWIEMVHPPLSALPVWVTESGVALCEHAIPGHPCVNDQEEQAAYAIQQYAYASTIEAERLTHSLDDGTLCPTA